MKKIKIGWVGSGFVGQVAHLPSFSTIKNVEITGLAELREDLRKKVVNKYNIENEFKNHKELLEYGKFDGIIVIVRRNHTATIAKDILEAGFNLFTEKPMASILSQGKSLVEIAKKKKLLYVVGNMRRHDEGVNVAKQYFDKFMIKKNLGNLISFRSYCYAGGDYCNIDGDIKSKIPAPKENFLPLAPKWVDKKDTYNFEKFLTFFVHDINLINYFFKEDPNIRSVSYNKHGGNINFEYKDFFGSFDYAYLDQDKWEEGLDILFERGSIKIVFQPAFLRNSPTKITIYREDNQPITLVPKINFSWLFKNQAIDFINCIKNNQPSKSSGESSLKDMKIIETILKKIL